MLLRGSYSGYLIANVCAPVCILLAHLAPAFAEGETARVETALESKIDSLSDLVTRPADRDALKTFYAGRAYRPVWFDEGGPTRTAAEVIKEMAAAETWGLKAADFQLPEAASPFNGGRWTVQQTAAAEFELAASILRYARHARGGRIGEPEKMLSEYLDRRPALAAPADVLGQLTQASHPGDALRSFHPLHEQFAKLHDLYVKLRGQSKGDQTFKIALKGPHLVPGQTRSEAAVLRRRLGGTAASGTEDLYDDDLVTAVKSFQQTMSLRADGIVGPATRKALNEEAPDKLQAIVASMEQWRWMPRDLGRTHLIVNIPAFTIGFVKDGVQKLEERVIVGKHETQTPIFSKDMTAVVLRPSWFLPDSIKLEKLLTAARRGKSIEDEGIVIKKGARVVKSWDVDWNTAKLSEYSIFQPSGDGNALGEVKFLFPNKHSVYLHDTPKKSLFEASERLFSHGCVRLRNPLAMAQLLLDNDKGAGAFDVASLVRDGPGSNQVMLDTPLPMHIGYFSVWVDADGEAQFHGDPYGHDERITLALNQKWETIDKGVDHLAEVSSEREKSQRTAPDIPAGLRQKAAQERADKGGEDAQARKRARAFAPPQGLIKAAESHETAPPKPQNSSSGKAHRAGYVSELMQAAYVH